MYITPWLWTPLTDFTGEIHNFQDHPFCADMELRVADCLEAYGWNLGHKKCAFLLKDFQECVWRTKRNLRNHDMMVERNRQNKKGERAVPYEPCPPLDKF